MLDHAWLLLWTASSLLQCVGAWRALRAWWQATLPGWKVFWLAFVINWGFTLAHQVIWGVFSPGLEGLNEMGAGVLKLGAMVAELFIMMLAARLELLCGIVPPPPHAVEPPPPS